MSHFDFFWTDRYFEIFSFVLLTLVAFQKKRPIFLLVILFLNTVPDLWMIPPSSRVHWINPPQTSSSSTQWISRLRDLPPQSALVTVAQPLIKKLLPTQEVAAEKKQEVFNNTAFYLRFFFLILVLMLFLVDHVHGVAGLGAFLFPTFYTLQRLFQGIDMIIPFQFERQLLLFRESPLGYVNGINSNPSGLWMSIIAFSTIAMGYLIFYYFTRRQSRAYNILVPNPENYQVLLQGTPHDYHYTKEGVIIDTVLFPFNQALSNQLNRKELHFTSGTVLKFVKRVD